MLFGPLHGGANQAVLEMLQRIHESGDDADGREYFIGRKLYPNVDFYTGLIYKAMGFPRQVYVGAPERAYVPLEDR